MRRAIKAATKIEQAYQDASRDLGCIVCRWRLEMGLQESKYGQCGATQIHHRNLDDKHGQKQIGQSAVVSLGAWHHDGIPPMFWGDTEATAIYGPSFKFGRTFRDWTAEAIPSVPGRGTESWQHVQDRMLIEAGFGELVEAVRRSWATEISEDAA